ncbi:MAG: hypothetical protein J5367_06695 [Lachnospiraceae bacterium]|nr:hypothetical protein [Lachnospiraceae bacterium]
MESDKIRLRRYEDDLYVSGTGAIVMGIWAVTKTIMELFFVYTDIFKYDNADPSVTTAEYIISYILLGLILVLILWFHYYAGINAVRAAKGRKYKKGYFAMTVFLLVMTILSLASYADDGDSNSDTTAASFLVDLTTIYIFVMIIISSVRIRKLKSTQQVRE